MSDLTDIASYDVLKCDVLGVRCERIFISDNYYNRDGFMPREDAHLEWNENQQKLAFIFNDEVAFVEGSE